MNRSKFSCNSKIIGWAYANNGITEIDKLIEVLNSMKLSLVKIGKIYDKDRSLSISSSYGNLERSIRDLEYYINY